MGRPERPVDPEDGPVQRFAWELRRLRERAGAPSYRQLSRRAHFSATALSEAAGGEQLPSLAVALAYVRACAGDVGEWEQRWRAARRAPDDAPPYLGLSTFGTGDAARFFGREALVADLVARLGRQRVVGVFGPSGSGKSSLLRAGLLPALAGRQVAVTTPTAWPRTGFHDAEVVVVDQFEELFTHVPDQDAFVSALLGAGHRVVLAARANVLRRCAAVPRLWSALRDARIPVGPMTDDELCASIQQPARRSGLRVQPELLAAALADVRGRSGALPLLSQALLETWRRRERGGLTLAGYRAGGGVAGAVAATAERTYTALSPRERVVARAVLLRLVQTTSSAVDPRRRAPLDEVLAAGRPAETAQTVERLAAARLVVVGEDRVELAHEEVTRAWPRLRRWIDEDRESLRLHRDLTAAAAAWESAGRDPGALHRGAKLAAVRELARRDGWAVSSTALERAFLRAATDQEADQERTRRAGRLRRLVRFSLG